MKKYRLDKEEQEILDSIERGEWKSVPHVRGEMSRHIQIARNTLRKNKRINIRMPQKDWENLQVKAIEEGIPYQTLIASVLHKYVVGILIPKTR